MVLNIAKIWNSQKINNVQFIIYLRVAGKLANLTQCQSGFILDIVNILSKNNLVDVLPEWFIIERFQ